MASHSQQSDVCSTQCNGCVTIQMYWLGPLLAGVVAGLLYDLVFAGNASVAKAKAFFTQSDYDDSQFGAPEAGPSAVV